MKSGSSPSLIFKRKPRPYGLRVAVNGSRNLYRLQVQLREYAASRALEIFQLLPFLGWDRFDLGRKARMRRRIYRSVLHLGARRICSKEVVTVPIRRRSDRSRGEPTAAIWADITQNMFDAHNAEGTLVGADTRLKRIGRQRLIAMLAGRSQFKHGVFDGCYLYWAINDSWNLFRLLTPIFTFLLAQITRPQRQLQ